MWKILSGSTAGISHQRLGVACQDFCLVETHRLNDQECLVVTIADGAGSALYSGVGARQACESLRGCVTRGLDSVRLVEVSRSQVVDWYRQVQADLTTRAHEFNVAPRELACTLLCAVVSDSEAVFAQVGDGALLVGGGQALQPVFWPQSGEYANTTHFVTGPDLADVLQFELRPERIEEFAGFTDGLQSVALNYALRQAHQPFVRPLLDSLRRSADPGELVEPMQTFLRSPALARRTDDDLTLVLATRLP